MKVLLLFFLVTFFAPLAFSGNFCSSYLSGSDHIRIMMGKARHSFNRKKYSEAQEILSQILEINPDEYRALGFRSRVLNEQGLYTEALDAQLRVVELEPDYREATYMALAGIYQKLGNNEAALIEVLSKIVEHNSKHVEALGTLARIHMSRGELNRARDLLAQKFEIDQNDKHTLGVLAELFYQKEDFDNALKFANHLLHVARPKKNQVKIPKSFVIGLSIRSKINAARAHTADKALDDIVRIENIFSKFSPWLEKIKAEAYFRRGAGRQEQFSVEDLKSSLEALNNIMRQLKKPDLSIVAAAVRVQRQLPEFDEAAYLKVWEGLLGEKAVESILDLVADSDWDAAPQVLKGESTAYSVRNSFWSVLYVAPVDGFTRRSTFARESHF